MRHARTTVLLGCALLAIALVGCDQERGGPRVVGEDGVEIEITAMPTETGTATIVAPGEPTGTPATATATPEATETATATPASTATSTATPSGGTGADSPGLSGVPYSTSDVRAAVEDEGLTFQVDDEREPMCPDTSVPETVFRTGESGQTWALWVYPDAAARESEWELEDGQLQPQTDDCAPPTGFNYFNANVVIALVERADSGPDEVRDAFLGIGAPASGDEDDEDDED